MAEARLVTISFSETNHCGTRTTLFFSQLHVSEPHEYTCFATKLPPHAACFRKIDKVVALSAAEKKKKTSPVWVANA